MDGLECSEIRKSELEFSGRIDAEYYQKQYLLFEQMVRKNDYHRMAEICHFLIGPFGSAYDTSNYVEESKYRYIRGQDVKPFFVQEMSPRFMAEQDFLRLQKYALKENDLLVSVVGTLGNACIIQAKELPAIFSCKSTAVRADSVDPYYLLAYTNSKYGRKLLLRKERGAIQKGLNLDDLKTFEVPSFSDVFQQEIAWLIQKAQQLKTSSQSLYRNAERVLDEQLNVQINDQRSPVSSVKYLSESFLSSGRLDAEYYQPKYDSLFEAIEQFACKPLGGSSGIVTIKKSIEPGSDAYQNEGIPFVRVSDVSKFEVSEPELFLPDDVIENAESLFPKKDTILFSKDGSVGIAYKVEEDMRIITSGALLHLTVRDTDTVLPDYLTLVLNSPIVQLQAERDANGAIIQHWKPSEIEKVVIPVLDMSIQREISDKVQESFALRHKSKELLEYAKQAVEMAIEQGEETALDWLKDKVSACE